MSKRTLCLILSVLLLVGLFAGCSAKQEPANTPSAPAESEKPSDTEQNASDEAGIGGDLEVAVFSNGETMDAFWDTIVAEYNAVYPDVNVTLIKSANIEETMRPRFISGDAPDVYYMGGQANVDEVTLTQEGKFMYLSDWYETAEAIGYDGLLKDNIATELFNRPGAAI